MKSFITKTIIATISALFTLINVASSQNSSLGIFKGHSDIGNVEFPGTSKYISENQEYILEGSGYNIWFGWMLRNDLSTSSPHVSAVVHGDGLTSLQYRRIIHLFT